VVKLEPDPVIGVAPTDSQENVNGAVPPVADPVKVSDCPTAPVVGPVIVAVNGRGLIVMEVVLFAVAAFMSVTVTVTVNVPLTV